MATIWFPALVYLHSNLLTTARTIVVEGVFVMQSIYLSLHACWYVKLVQHLIAGSPNVPSICERHNENYTCI